MSRLSNLPQRFDHRNLLSEDPKKRLVAIEWAIDAATQWVARLRVLEATMTEELATLTAALQTRIDTPWGQDKRQSLKDSMKQLHHGVTQADGISDDRVNFMVEQPGIDHTLHILDLLREAHAEWESQATVDPNQTARYRLKDGHEHVAGSRLYHGGDVVELNAHQAVNWADKFDKVYEDEQASATATAPTS
jgi:hypothetical protein